MITRSFSHNTERINTNSCVADENIQNQKYFGKMSIIP